MLHSSSLMVMSMRLPKGYLRYWMYFDRDEPIIFSYKMYLSCREHRRDVIRLDKEKNKREGE
jgi:hypothetical protein